MNQRVRLLNGLKAGGAGLALAALLAGCHRDVVVVPAAPDYYPVVVGTYRTYAVMDSTWKNGVATAVSYQLREAVREQFTDATGQTAYRVVRSHRATPTAAWVDDSTLVVQPLARQLLLTANNTRTIELVYPVRAGHAWNASAYNGAAPDSIVDVTRAYDPTVGQAFTTPAVPGYPAKTYDAAVTTRRILPTGGEDINLFYGNALRQVYARGVGLVLRRRFAVQTFAYSGGAQVPVQDPQNGTARLEVLVDSGSL